MFVSRSTPRGYIVDEVKVQLDKLFLTTDLPSYPLASLVDALPFHPLDIAKAVRFWAGELEDAFILDGPHLRRTLDK